MDVDKLFKLPSVPQSSLNKRKWAEPSSSALKAARVEDVDEDDRSHTRLNGKHASVSGVGEDKNSPVGPQRPPAVDDEDEEHDADFAPGNDADYFIEEDDEGGRFFGGGLTAQQKRILELMNQGSARDASNGDGARDEDDEGLSPEQELKNLRRSLLRLERAITKNQELRAKHAEEPAKFIESEAELHDAVRALVVVTTNPALLYPELIKQGTAASLCGLLTHENIDISASVIELIEEMTDDDVLDAGLEGRTEGEQEEGVRRGQLAVESVLDELQENALLELVVQTLPRLQRDESKTDEVDSATAQANAESDAATLYHLLGLVENLVSLRPKLADVFLDSKTFRSWLLHMILPKTQRDQNKNYAGELLSILLQTGTADDLQRRCLRMGERGAIDTLLEALSPLRKHLPHDDDEREFTENLFDALCALLDCSDNKKRFFDAEGIELMCLVAKNKGFPRLRALKTASIACSGPQGAQNATRFVENAGLKYLFSTLMRGSGSEHVDTTSQDEVHMIELIMSLLNNLASGSLERIRLVSKFVEADYEKVDRIVELRSAAQTRLLAVEREIAREMRAMASPLDEQDREERETDIYLRRLESGLFTLQLSSYILAWLIMEDDGIQAHVKFLLQRRGDEDYDVVHNGDVNTIGEADARGSLFRGIIRTLKEYYENVGEDILVAEAENPDEEPLRLRDVIVQLVNYLLGL